MITELAAWIDKHSRWSGYHWAREIDDPVNGRIYSRKTPSRARQSR